MNRDTIRSKLQTDQAWLERAIKALSLDNKWSDADRKSGEYYANWLRQDKSLTGDFVVRARALALKYVDELLHIALANTRDRIKAHEERLSKLRERMAEVTESLEKERRAEAAISASLEQLPLTGAENLPFEKKKPGPSKKRTNERFNKWQEEKKFVPPDPPQEVLIDGKPISQYCHDNEIY